MRRLTPKEEVFAQAIMSGKNQSEAYRTAYPNQKCNANVTAVAANRVANRAVVSARLVQLRNMAARPAILTRARKLEKLAAMIENANVVVNDQLTSDQLKAVEIDNKMQGHQEAEKLKVTGLGSLLQKIRAAAPKP